MVQTVQDVLGSWDMTSVVGTQAKSCYLMAPTPSLDLALLNRLMPLPQAGLRSLGTGHSSTSGRFSREGRGCNAAEPKGPGKGVAAAGWWGSLCKSVTSATQAQL